MCKHFLVSKISSSPVCVDPRLDMNALVGDASLVENVRIRHQILRRWQVMQTLSVTGVFTTRGIGKIGRFLQMKDCVYPKCTYTPLSHWFPEMYSTYFWDAIKRHCTHLCGPLLRDFYYITTTVKGSETQECIVVLLGTMDIERSQEELVLPDSVE